tara:strand:+ start:246 stop:1160 length:915 start_codon:yes stop_codon:yes gene_type:complete
MQWEFYNYEMAKNMDFSEWTLKGVLKELEDLNLIERIYHRDSNSRYTKREIIVRLEVTKEELEEFIKLKNKNSKNLQSPDIVESEPLVDFPPVAFPPVENPPTYKRKNKERKNKEISLLANISSEDITLDLIKKEAKRREKDIKSFIKEELRKKISGDEYKKLFENFCNNYFEWIQRKEIKSYTAAFDKFISEQNSYKSNEPTKQSFALPKSKNPPPPVLELGLADTSKDFIDSSQKWQKLLQENFEQDVFDKWIKCLIPHRRKGEKVIFSVKGKFVRDWIIREYQEEIENLLNLKLNIISTES